MSSQVRQWPGVVYARVYSKEGDRVVSHHDGLPTWIGQARDKHRETRALYLPPPLCSASGGERRCGSEREEMLDEHVPMVFFFAPSSCSR